MSAPDDHYAVPRLARIYDVFDDDRSDLDHYEALIEELLHGRPSRRVMDVGCGTGSLAVRLAERGIEVVGVDPAAASLDVARGKPGADRVRWVEGDATRLPVTEDIDVVVMTGNVAQVFVDDEEWGAALRRAAAVLGPGGHLVFETRDPDARAWETWPTAKGETVDREVAGEGLVSTWMEVTEVALPLVTFEGHATFPDGETLTSTSTLRFRTRDEVERSLADAWLDLVEVREAPDRPGLEMVFVARKPVDPRDSEDRGWRDMARIDADLAAGAIDEATWHQRVLDLLEPAYLSAATPHAQSGKGGGPADWDYARSLVADAIDRDGTFLDIGCANGLLMQDVCHWAADRGFDVEPHGVDIGAGLVALARERCPQWADRIHHANAHGWLPPQTYDYVRTGLDYVPEHRRADYVEHLLTHVVAPGGRLVIGVHNLADDSPLPDEIASWGHEVAGSSRRPHKRPGTSYAVLWINRAASAAQ